MDIKKFWIRQFLLMNTFKRTENIVNKKTITNYGRRKKNVGVL